MSSSNCCFLTYTQISPEAGQGVWYSHLFKNFPVCCDPSWHCVTFPTRTPFLISNTLLNGPGSSGIVTEMSTWETKPHTQSWRIRFFTPAGPEELTLQALNPGQRGYRVFIHERAWLNGFAGLQGLDDCKEQDKGEWDNLQFLALWVPTFWDLRDPDLARSQLSYRGRRSRRLCKILTFPFHSPLLMLLSLVESIISCFGRTFRAPRHLGGYIELLPFVTLWI